MLIKLLFRYVIGTC